MTKQVERIMVWPQIVPIRMATKLAAAGIGKSSCIHKHIRNGTLRSLRGIGHVWEARIINMYSSPPRQLTEDVLAGRIKFVSNDGLDAVGFLLLAEGHLQKAKELLAKKPGSCPYLNTKHAISTVRLAMTQLKYEKEDSCKP